MTEITITSLMMQHHSVVLGLLNKLKEAVDNGQGDIRDIFMKFESQAKEHFSIEESVIFNFSDKMDAKSTEIILGLMREHQTMLSLMELITKGLPENDFLSIYDLEKIMLEHAEVEEKILYPGLDGNLEEEKKVAMIKRIQETSGELLISNS